MLQLRVASVLIATALLTACGDDGGAGAGAGGASGSSVTSGAGGSTDSPCANGVQDAGEEGVYCGGAECGACPYGPCEGRGAACPPQQVCIRTLCEDTLDCPYTCHPQVEGPCTTDSCGSGRYCVRQASGEQSSYGCAPRVGLGEYCERDRQCAEGSFCSNARICKEVFGAGEVCRADAYTSEGQYSCVAGYTCQPPEFFGDDPLCKPALQQGASCNGTQGGCAQGLFCNTNLAEWACEPVAGPGESCVGFGYSCVDYYFCDGVCQEQG